MMKPKYTSGTQSFKKWRNYVVLQGYLFAKGKLRDDVATWVSHSYAILGVVLCRFVPIEVHK